MKKLYRSRSNRVIAGVCGGLAEYFDIDPTVIRIIAVVLLLPGGLPGLIPYVILWIVVPEAPNASLLHPPEPKPEEPKPKPEPSDGTQPTDQSVPPKA